MTTKPTHGGARTGAGRPRGSLDPHTRLDNQIGKSLNATSPLGFLQNVADHPAVSLRTRVIAAKALMPYHHIKIPT